MADLATTHQDGKQNLAVAEYRRSSIGDVLAEWPQIPDPRGPDDINMYKHDKVTVRTDSGAKVEAVAPIVISASRATDLPAFYARWFFHRLERGYCAWINPFNKKRSYVSFVNARVIVFWTKNPAPILPYLDILDERGINYYFQYTLNDYEAQGLEPNVPSLQTRIATFRDLARRIGPERVIWRFDPIMLAPSLTPRGVLFKIWNIGNAVKGLTRKLVFSFVDIGAYKKVRNNLIRECPTIHRDNVPSCELDAGQRQEIAAGLANMRDHWQRAGWDLEVASCGEGIDLSLYGIGHNRCIDGELMARVFSHDEPLLRWLDGGRRPQGPGLFVQPTRLLMDPVAMKDKGQRKECGCALSKDIGVYNTCKHYCSYCYANSSRKHVAQVAGDADQQAECLIMA